MDQENTLTADEREEIVKRYRKLLKTSSRFLGRGEIRQIREAFDLALQSNTKLRRKSGEPFIYHPLAVAQIVVEEIGLSTDSVICALLHDAYSDNLIPASLLKEKFNPQLIHLLDGINKLSGLYTHNLKYQTENFISLFLTISNDVRIILIKLADRLHNIRHYQYFETEKQIKIATETRLIYAPIAHRLGLYNIKTEMEDLSLKVLKPQVYDGIFKKIEETKGKRKKYIDVFTAPIQIELEKSGLQFSIKSRVKSVNSIWNKMQKQNVEFEEVYDLFAIRIILKKLDYSNEKAACWNVYSIVSNLYQPSPERLRDWITTPKSSGYESLHTTVLGPDNRWVEIQIRTDRMDDIAEKGHAAHWKYKESGKESAHDQWLRKIRELIENPQMQDFDLSSQPLPQNPTHIFIFTPIGDILKLENGATVLDFAFAVHTNLGETCTGARVNNKIVPIKQVLKNGDKVEIITSKNQSPKQDWLNFVFTNRAKQKIKRALREIKYQQVELGKEVIERKLAQLKVDFNEESLFKILTYFKLKTSLDLYDVAANGKIDFSKFKEIFAPKKAEEKQIEIQSDSQKKSHVSKKDDILIIDEKLDHIHYKLARCCNPIPGDEIFGFVTINRGIQVHRSNCPNAVEMLGRFPYRIVKTRWANETENPSFLTEIIITGIDQMGLVTNLSKVISADMKVNMRSINVESNDGIFRGSIQLFVQSQKHLDELLHKVLKVKGVLKASRADESFV